MRAPHKVQESLLAKRQRITGHTLAIARVAGARTLETVDAGVDKRELGVDAEDPGRESSLAQELLTMEVPGLDHDAKLILLGALITIAQRAQRTYDSPAELLAVSAPTMVAEVSLPALAAKE